MLTEPETGWVQWAASNSSQARTTPGHMDLGATPTEVAVSGLNSQQGSQAEDTWPVAA